MKVSVVVPVYNCKNYIKQCLDSVLAQTLADIEIICVDDCSSDNSAEIIKKIDDERIKLIKNEKNLGAALSRNRGLSEAKGEYIYFIDSDDYIDVDYLEKMVETIEKTNVDIVLNLNIKTDGRKYIHPTMKTVSEQGEFIDKKKAIEEAPVFIWARLYRKSFLDKYDLKYIDTKKCNDVPFHYITQIYTDKIFVFKGSCYHYNSRKNSITGTGKDENDRDLWAMRAYNLIYDYMIENNLFDANIKLFNVCPHYKVDSEEKFEFFKQFFNKTRKNIEAARNIYNDLELFFADMILNSKNFDDYKTKYNPSVTMSYIRRKNAKTR